MNHDCTTIEKSNVVSIKCVDGRWFWCYAENLNTDKEHIHAHEIKYCPYCGLELKLLWDLRIDENDYVEQY